MYHHINSIHIVYIMSRMVLMGVLAGLLGLLLIGTVPFIVENIVWWHIYVHDLHCPSFVFHIIKLPEMMIYMRPWQLIYNIWYTRCIKLWYLVFLLIISCIYIRTFIYIIYLLLNTSWIHHGIISILIPTTPDPFFLWIARICFKTCLHPLRSLAYGVRWIPTERLEDLKMAISNVLFLNALDDFLVRIDDDFLLFLDHFLDVLLFHAFLDVPEPLLSYIHRFIYMSSYVMVDDVIRSHCCASWCQPVTSTAVEVVVSRTRFSTSRYARLGRRRRHETKHLFFFQLFIGCVALWCLLLYLS